MRPQQQQRVRFDRQVEPSSAYSLVHSRPRGARATAAAVVTAVVAVVIGQLVLCHHRQNGH